MRLTVVTKVILGFGLLACLMLGTTLLSYVDLLNIRHAAQDVVQQKVPVQNKMMQVQTSLLRLAKISTTGFNLDSIEAVQTNRDEFEQLAMVFEQQLTELENLTSNENAELTQASTTAEQYLQNSKQMYQFQLAQMRQQLLIQQKMDESYASADEASALVIDLSYLENNATNLKAMIGTGSNIDNKLADMLPVIKEFANVDSPEQVETVKQDLTYLLSNIQVDSDYLNRLADSVPNEGIVDSFNQQHSALKRYLQQLFELKTEKLTQLDNLNTSMAQANRAQELALSSFAALFAAVSQQSLQGQNIILENVELSLIQSFVILAIALVAVLVIATVATRSIARPLGGINRSLEIMSSGDLTKKVREVGNDEFTRLAKSVNQLSASLHQVVKEINAQEKRLEEAACASVELGEATLRQVALQQEQVNQTASNTQQVQATSASNRQQIEEAMHRLADVTDQSQQASHFVGQSRQQVDKQAQQARSSAQIVQRLETNSNNIGGILDVIKNIAEQTNLLALNAAIEAARAGEQGRGFAVVADEVRTLATRTQASTEEIEQMIVSLQTDAKSAREEIMLGSEQADHSVALISQVESQIKQMTEIVVGLNRINEKIVEDTQHQDNLLSDVAQSLKKIVTLAEQSAASTAKANEASLDVERHTEQLKRAVASFIL